MLITNWKNKKKDIEEKLYLKKKTPVWPGHYTDRSFNKPRSIQSSNWPNPGPTRPEFTNFIRLLFHFRLMVNHFIRKGVSHTIKKHKEGHKSLSHLSQRSLSFSSLTKKHSSHKNRRGVSTAFSHSSLTKVSLIPQRGLSHSHPSQKNTHPSQKSLSSLTKVSLILIPHKKTLIPQKSKGSLYCFSHSSLTKVSLIPQRGVSTAFSHSSLAKVSHIPHKKTLLPRKGLSHPSQKNTHPSQRSLSSHKNQRGVSTAFSHKLVMHPPNFALAGPSRQMGSRSTYKLKSKGKITSRRSSKPFLEEDT